MPEFTCHTHDWYLEKLEEALNVKNDDGSNGNYMKCQKVYGDRAKELKLFYQAAQVLQRTGQLRGSAWMDFMDTYQELKAAHKATYEYWNGQFRKGPDKGLEASISAQQAQEILRQLG
jgi:hypothetical protein